VPVAPGDGLLLRRARPEDAEAVAAFDAEAHHPLDPAHIAAWTRGLLGGAHPTTRAAGATLVEDTRTGAVVSAMIPISQTWTHGGVALPVIRTELVGTHPADRRRGPVRRRLEAVHRWSAARGDLVQAISSGCPPGPAPDDRGVESAPDQGETRRRPDPAPVA
jgi:hypothetical protein